MDVQPSAGRAAAKTAHFYSARSGALVLRNTLDPPFKLKWPEISAGNSTILLQQLKSSFSELRRPPKAKKSLKKKGKKEMPAKDSTDSCDSAPPSKRPHLEDEETNTDSNLVCGDKQARPSVPVGSGASTDSCTLNATTVHARPSAPLGSGASTDSCALNATLREDNDSLPVMIGGRTDLGSAESTKFSQDKRSQVVVGINAVTRHLEQDKLRCGLVCLSATPSLMHRHILMLAATRGVPFAALSNLSEITSPLLGVKSALALGIKKLPVGESPEQDHFSDLLAAILRLAPPIRIPWLTVSKNSDCRRANTETEARTQDSASLQTKGELAGRERTEDEEGLVSLSHGNVPTSSQVEDSLVPISSGVHTSGTDIDREECSVAVGKARQTTVGVEMKDGTTFNSGTGERGSCVKEEECHRGCEEGGVRVEEKDAEKIGSEEAVSFSASHLVSSIISRQIKKRKKFDQVCEAPNVEYFPLNIKKTIARPKRSKK